MRSRMVIVAIVALATSTLMAQGGEFETVATFATAGATENITTGADGAVYVTGMDDRVVWRIATTGAAATPSKFASIPDVAAVVGIAPSGDGVVVTAFGKPFRKPAAAGGPPQIDF